MNGIHDMGGMHGFGAIPDIENETAFHHEWERRMFALNMATGALGLWNIDQSRAEMEATPAEEYLRGDDYFRRFLLRLERLAVSHGLANPSEIEAGHRVEPPSSGLTALTPERLAVNVAVGSPSARPKTRARLFNDGDRVRARMLNPATHTRLPRYVRGHLGVVVHTHGMHVYPDHSALGRPDAEWLYSVVFDGRQVWGEECEPGCEVVVDAFEPYLEHA